jgi:hypothetical protein
VTVNASRDTFITEIAGNTNTPHGADTFLYLVRGGIGVSGFRTFPLVWFDTSAFAGGTVNGDGQISLQLTGSNRIPNLTVQVRQSLVAWNESTVTFANIGGTGFNEATQAGGTLSSTLVSWSGNPQQVTFPVPASVIQFWIDNPAQNFGLFLFTPATTGADDKVFSSREGAFAPTLTLDVSVVPELPPAALFLAGLGALALFRKGLHLRRPSGAA